MMEDIESLRAKFESRGQGHIFAFWDTLGEAGRDRLLEDLREVDLDEVEGLVQAHMGEAASEGEWKGDLAPAPYIAHPKKGGDAAAWEAAVATGEAALRAGRVAAFTVAGGQGTRLGYPGPKGTFPVTPVTNKTLFAVFAEKLLAAQQRYGRVIPWYVMTSRQNHEATITAFQEHDYFGLAADSVHFFSQGRMPAVDFAGKLLLEEPDCLAMSPDGHGGSFRALVRSGAVADMQQRGIDTLSYFQVDNPLVQVIDPAFIGFHLQARSEMSSKMIPKAYPDERVGVFCQQDASLCVIEYSDLPESMQTELDENRRLRYIAGSIAIHCLAVEFVARMGGGDVRSALPFHKAIKKIRHVSASGEVIEPAAPNGVKFEMFVFDALPQAAHPVVIETIREDDFSPVKNPSGVDSAESCRADQLRQWARWFRAAGVPLEVDASGLPAVTIEVSPLFADSEEAFVSRWKALEVQPAVVDGLVLTR
jgi:UDP-N-acetylglucosamine/UDP-N-acetylgalactosamine diphosphorylase